MQYVVTGATGLIGAHVVQRLLRDEKSCEVVAVGRNSEKLATVFGRYAGDGRLRLKSCDFSDASAVASMLSDVANASDVVVFHAAGPVSGAVIRSNPLAVIKPNVFALKSILDVSLSLRASGCRCRVVVFSSATVYGAQFADKHSVREDETSQAEGLDAWVAPYSESKRMAEVMARAYVKELSADVVVARPSYVYGASAFMQGTAFTSFLADAVAGRRITLNSNDLGRRDNVYVDDVVSGMLAIASRGVAGEAYNISSNGVLGNYAAVDEMAKTVARVCNAEFGGAVEVGYRSEVQGDRKPGFMLNNEKLLRLGWRPEFSLEEGVRAALGEFRG